MKHIIGIDMSMSSPAICISPEDNIDLDFKHCKFFNIQTIKKYCGVFGNIRIDKLPPPKTYLSREARYDFLKLWMEIILMDYTIEQVFIEGYSMGSKGNISGICELGGVIRHVLFSNGYKIIELPPKTVKKVFSGAGDANKDEMIDTFTQRTKVDLSKQLGIDDFHHKLITDIADSYAVLYTGLRS